MLRTTFAREAIASSEAGSATSATITSGRADAELAEHSPDLLRVAAGDRPVEAVSVGGPLGQMRRDEAPGDAGGAEDDDREVPGHRLGRRGEPAGGCAWPRPWLPAAVGAGRLVDAVDDVARVGDAGEDEVVVVGGGGVEVDVADLHDPLVDATAGS